MKDISWNTFALRLMRRHYGKKNNKIILPIECFLANALLHMRQHRNRNNTDQPTCSSSGDQ